MSQSVVSKKLKGSAGQSVFFEARTATIDDCKAVKGLIAQYCGNDPQFQSRKLDEEDSHFFNDEEEEGRACLFVVKDPDFDRKDNIIGFVSGRQKNPFEFELLQVFSVAKYRDSGLGEYLIETVLNFATKHMYERVNTQCLSGDTRKVYQELGFHDIGNNRLWKNVPNRRKVSKVAIVGGTHGNELIGVHLVKNCWNTADHKDFQAFPSMTIVPCLANEDAAKLNVRFVDRDLNRCFELDELLSSEKVDNLETKRATYLNSQVLGPKCHIKSSIGHWKKDHPQAVDYMIDLHSTTSNM